MQFQNMMTISNIYHSELQNALAYTVEKSPITEAAYIKKLIEWSIFCYLQIFTFYPLWSIQKQNYIISRTDKKKKLILGCLLQPFRTLHQIYYI